mmetsp:Transcript_82982/g.235410  ORF Transcript_82982/g.235410 Transcript_82982/m.235410 type:complete len:202 (+) Transcript_82982:646-1251(+)
MAEHDVVADQGPDVQLQLQVVVCLEGLRHEDQPGARRVQAVQEAVGVRDVAREGPRQDRLEVARQVLRAPHVRRVHLPARRLVHHEAVGQVQRDVGHARHVEARGDPAVARPGRGRAGAVHVPADLQDGAGDLLVEPRVQGLREVEGPDDAGDAHGEVVGRVVRTARGVQPPHHSKDLRRYRSNQRRVQQAQHRERPRRVR